MKEEPYTEYKLSEKDIAAVEKALNARGAPKVEIVIEKGAVVVLKVQRERVK